VEWKAELTSLTQRLMCKICSCVFVCVFVCGAVQCRLAVDVLQRH